MRSRIVLGVVCVGLSGLAVNVLAAPVPALVDVEARFTFSHALHIETDASLTCVDCHDAAKSGPSRPAFVTDRCLQCHDEVPLVAARATGRRLDVVFDHRPHAAATCVLCHAPVVPPPEGRAEHRTIATSSLCIDCHEAATEHAPGETACARCHGRDARRTPPPSHGPTWDQTHGASAFPSGLHGLHDHGQSCMLCHTQSTCRACHRNEAPQDHTGLWRTRTHGSAAAWDRTRCQTCHESGECISCHRSTPPQNHHGAWQAVHGLVARTQADTSCMACHRPSTCIDCHRGTR